MKRFIFILLLLVVPLSAHAVYPATSTITTYAATETSTAPTAAYVVTGLWLVAGDTWPSKPHACLFQGAAHDAHYGVPGQHEWEHWTTTDQCRFRIGTGTWTYRSYIASTSCPSGSTLSGGQCVSLTCTAGDVRSGSTCTHTAYSCPSPDVENAGYCSPPQNNCVAGTQYNNGFLPADMVGTPACINGCATTFQPPIINGTVTVINYSRLMNGVQVMFDKGGYTVTDPATSCSPDTVLADAETPKALPQNTCPVGKRVGFINGIAICYDAPPTANPNDPPPKTTTKEPTTTNTAPDGTVTTVDTTTEANGSKTTVTTVTLPNGSTSTTTERSTPDQVTTDSFCSANPNDPSCTKDKTPCELDPESIGCQKLGTIPNAEAIPTKEVGTVFNEVSIQETGTCPAPKVINLSAITITLPFDVFCYYAEGIRPVLLTLAYLSGMFIVIGGFKEAA